MWQQPPPYGAFPPASGVFMPPGPGVVMQPQVNVTVSSHSSHSSRSEVVKADIADALKRPDWKNRWMSPRTVFNSVGVVLLSLISMFPIWNSVVLLQDSNYVFWAGRSVPYLIILSCVIIIAMYTATISVFFRRPQNSVLKTEATVIMIANIFITLFGIFLMTASLPISHQTQLTYTNLLHRCIHSDQTHRLFEYSQVLQNIRASPACQKKYSVEECEGYEAAEPYTSFLKGMENNYRCAGFCYRPTKKKKAASLLQNARKKANSQMQQTSLITEGVEDGEEMDLDAKIDYPPTLFSKENFQASCEGMAARDMVNFAGQIGKQTFFQGVAFISITVVTGFLKLASFCNPQAAA